MALGLILMVVDYFIGQRGMLIAATATFVSASGCAFFAGVLKKREIAILFPVIFCAIAFTVYALKGAGEGSAMLWTMMLPIGLCYFVSVKYGILLSVYYSVLFIALFYTPLGDNLNYGEAFAPKEIADRSICIDGDIADILDRLKE